MAAVTSRAVMSQESEMQQMLIDDVVTEALEVDNLALQTMSSGKYVQVYSFFPTIFKPSSGPLNQFVNHAVHAGDY